MSREELIGIVDALYRTRFHDLRSAGLALLERQAKLLGPKDVDWLLDLVRASHNWAHVDWIATKPVGALVTAHPRLLRALPRWGRDEDFWIRRTALLAQLDELRAGRGDFDLFEEIAVPLLEEREFFIRKAIGSVLREVAKKRPELVERFLDRHAARCSGLTIREAAKHLPEVKEKALRAGRDAARSNPERDFATMAGVAMTAPITTSELRAMLTADLADGHVDLNEVTQVEQAVASRGIDSVDATNLLDAFDQDVGKFNADAKASFAQFVDDQLPSVVLPDVAPPPVDQPANAEPKAAGETTYAPVIGSVFGNGVTLTDADQGQAGDCFIIASLASLAEQKPKLLENAIHSNNDGTFTVTFWDRSDPTAPPKPVQIQVDDSLPEWNKGQLYYAHDRDSGKLWPSLIEKAYAKWKGGYEVIGRGGEMSDVLDALTGEAPRFSYPTSATDPNKLFTTLQQALAGGGAVVAGSHGYDPDQPPYENPDVVFGHAYTVVSVQQQNGQQTVTLRNPWGYKTTQGADGLFTLSMTDFIHLFEEVDWVP